MRCVYNRISIVFFLIIMLFTCGCQQTPERTAVIYGRDLMDKIEGPSAPFASYDAPVSWQETLDMKGSDTKFKINASISVPNVTAFPVYKAEHTEFDDSRIELLVNYFTKGEDVIKYTEPTKAELESQLLLAKKNNDEEMVAEFERRIAVAPETVEVEKITDWSAAQSPSGHFSEKDGKSSISVTPDSFTYMKGFVITESMLKAGGRNIIGEVSISDDEAVVAAQNMIHEFGIDYMVAVTLEKAQRYTSIDDAFVESSEGLLSKGYLIKFARNIDGIAGITDHAVGFYGQEEIHYKAPLHPEEIQIYVDEAGKVQSFAWYYPLEIEEKLTENITLMPFEDVKQRIRDMLTFINSYNSQPAEVTSVNMNMTLVCVEDHPEEAMYVPAWFIYYTMTYEENIKQEYILALNAIDGGRILELPVEMNSEMQDKIREN